MCVVCTIAAEASRPSNDTQQRLEMMESDFEAALMTPSKSAQKQRVKYVRTRPETHQGHMCSGMVPDRADTGLSWPGARLAWGSPKGVVLSQEPPLTQMSPVGFLTERKGLGKTVHRQVPFPRVV